MHERAKRGDVGGWSYSSIRSNTRFLYGVDERGLTGTPFAITLTVRTCPPTADEWHKMRNALTRRLRRMGMIRMHWVTEWQRRGVPHLHGALWIDGTISLPAMRQRLVKHWLALASEFGAQEIGQHVASIDNAVGWFQYVSKHAARGLSHYQRCPERIPPEWKAKTGRMWGHVGDWPPGQATRIELSSRGFWAFRRIVRSWRIADARAQGNKRRLRQARGMLACSDRYLSAVRGVSEWVGLDESLPILAHLAGRGFRVDS